jgi:hypothetical protein
MNEMSKRVEPGLPQLREAVIEELTSQYSLERITMDEFESRVDAANRAQTRVGLESLLADLPALPVKGAAHEAEVRADETLPYRLNRGEVPQTGAAVCIFSGTERRGVWIPPKLFSALNVFGGSKIDLREAELPPDGMVIDVCCVFGGVEIVVPEGINLSIEGFGIFGGFSRQGPEKRYPGAPTITVRGIAFFGGADVKVAR